MGDWPELGDLERHRRKAMRGSLLAALGVMAMPVVPSPWGWIAVLAVILGTTRWHGATQEASRWHHANDAEHARIRAERQAAQQPPGSLV